jgi:hypothetical protein
VNDADGVAWEMYTVLADAEPEPAPAISPSACACET